MPLAWPTPGEVRGHQHLRARLEVRAVGDGPAQPRRRPSGSRRAPSPRRTGSGWRDSSDSSEWVIASMPVAAVDGRRQPDGQAGIEDRRDRQQRRMADVVLAPDLLVGDDREAVRLGAGARGRRDGDDRHGRASGPGRRTRAPRPVDRWRRGGRSPWPRPSPIRRRSRRRPRRPGRSPGGSRRRARPSRPPGSARSRRRSAVGRPAAVEGVEDRLDDPGRAHARIGHDEDAASHRPRRPPRGVARSPRPRTGPGCAASSRSAGRRASPIS